LALKKAGLKEVILTYIIPREEVGFVPYGGYLKDEEEHIKEQVRLRFEDWRQLTSERSIKSKIRIETGTVNALILRIAEEESVDLIVTGSKERTAFEKIYVGSHILDILRRSTVPILMGRYMVKFEVNEKEFTRKNDDIFSAPLLATDWSEPSEHGLEWIKSIKNVAQRVIISHIIDSKIADMMTIPDLKKLEADGKQRLEMYKQTLQTAYNDVETHLSIGKTVPEILRISRATNASMIVLGKTGKDWFEQYWLGGVSHRVAEISELPVLLVQ
jgi:nucleotide-binding universal stress UspA family protein